jgi:multiple sugar transport system permease protein
MGYASAMAWVLGIIMFIITFIQFKFQDKWVHE